MELDDQIKLEKVIGDLEAEIAVLQSEGVDEVGQLRRERDDLKDRVVILERDLAASRQRELDANLTLMGMRSGGYHEGERA